MTTHDGVQPVTTLGPLNPEDDNVVVAFQGQALQALRDLQTRLSGVSNEQDVVLRGVQLLLSAVDKEVLLRQGDRTEVIRLWKR